MGGWGSGRHWPKRKRTTAECYQLDVRRWQRDGVLQRGLSFALHWHNRTTLVMSLSVAVAEGAVRARCAFFDGQTWQQLPEYEIPLERTACRYGGSRMWFRCVEPECRRRVVILYGINGVFVCRRCYGLGYESQRKQPYDRALRRARAIRMKLGGSANMLEPFPPKPKRMHWRTYWRLRQESEEAHAHSLRGLLEELDRLEKRI